MAARIGSRRRDHGKTRKAARRWPPSAAVLDRLVEEATVDAHEDDECEVGVFTRMQDSLRVPFAVEVLGVAATVEQVELPDSGGIVAVCRRGSTRQRIAVLDLRLPREIPHGAEWIEAYRRLVRPR